jgi:hypothetical protein
MKVESSLQNDASFHGPEGAHLPSEAIQGLEKVLQGQVADIGAYIIKKIYKW